jgi:hypothetical protein
MATRKGKKAPAGGRRAGGAKMSRGEPPARTDEALRRSIDEAVAQGMRLREQIEERIAQRFRGERAGRGAAARSH